MANFDCGRTLIRVAAILNTAIITSAISTAMSMLFVNVKLPILNSASAESGTPDSDAKNVCIIKKLTMFWHQAQNNALPTSVSKLLAGLNTKSKTYLSIIALCYIVG